MNIFKASGEGDLNRVSALLESGGGGDDVNSTDRNGKTPLFLAVEFSRAKVIKFLIDNGADVNKIDLDGKSPLMSAHSVEIAKMLVNAGADINYKNTRVRPSETSLSLAMNEILV